MGYGPMVGVDLSPGMLSVAKRKDIYVELRQMTLGEQLDLPDRTFGAIRCCGTISPKHAPAHSFDELVRVAKPGAVVVFSLRDDDAQEPEFLRKLEDLEHEKRWRPMFRTPDFRGMPYGDLQISHRVYVYEVSD